MIACRILPLRPCQGLKTFCAKLDRNQNPFLPPLRQPCLLSNNAVYVTSLLAMRIHSSPPLLLPHRRVGTGLAPNLTVSDLAQKPDRSCQKKSLHFSASALLLHSNPARNSLSPHGSPCASTFLTYHHVTPPLRSQNLILSQIRSTFCLHISVILLFRDLTEIRYLFLPTSLSFLMPHQPNTFDAQKRSSSHI